MIRGVKYFVPALIWTMIILWLSTSPGIQLPETFFSPDKLGHFIFYGVLTWLYLWGLKRTDKKRKLSLLWIPFLTSFYGFLLELVQYSFFPNRFFEIWDIIANIIGCFAAYMIFEKTQKDIEAF